MQEPEALLPYNPSFGFLAANRPCCQLFLPDPAFPSFPFKCKLHTGQIRWNIHFFLPFLCPVFQLNSLLLAKRSGPQIIALVRLQCGNCENYRMIDSQENESHSTKAKSLHFPWQLSIDFSYALLKRHRISQGCRSWSWLFLKAVCLCIFSRVTGRAFLQSYREGQCCHSLCAISGGAVAFFGGKYYLYCVWSIQKIIS